MTSINNQQSTTINPKVLVIDDEEDILALMTDTLEEEDYEVVTACNGAEGIEQFEKCRPDLVITDVKMPIKNGLEVLTEIKKISADVDVILLTGHSDEATAIECLRSGAYDYLLKPLEDIDILLTAITRALDKRKLEKKNRELVKELEELAIRDPLTGLYNRRHLHTRLDEEIARAERYRNTFCIVMLDIDHFKAVNDTYGHPFGDYVLKKLGEIIRGSLRNVDSLYRYGGEEFFILMPETAREGAEIVVNRSMTAISEYVFSCDGQEMNVTVSMGVSIFPDQANDQRGLISLADQALYRAKETGRDRVVFASDIDQ